jgi:hypothetical protein
MKLIMLLTGLLIGVFLGGYIQSLEPLFHNQQVNSPEQITSQIVLTIPKTQQEAEKQLLYMAASKGMLEEIHRQGVLRKK